MTYPSEEVIVNEQDRTYYWTTSTGVEPSWATYHNVVGVRVSESGNHYVRTMNGTLAIVKNTWDYIIITPEYPEKGWTF